MKPTFFDTPEEFRVWLDEHHDSESELLVGFLKKTTGKRSITWPEAVDQALCFGWIDGVRRSIDSTRYSIRFTPRKPGSRWSAVNIQRAADLEARGVMKAAGLSALATRSESKSRTYSYEQRQAPRLTPLLAKILKANKRAAAFMATLAPSYQRKVVHWVMTAKSADVQLGRLSKAMAAFEGGRKL
jgi:uncharacterized protein YdeI (YjbR/CyaY-like superfamily)